jgi:hypothetical protein
MGNAAIQISELVLPAAEEMVPAQEAARLNTRVIPIAKVGIVFRLQTI